MRQPVIPGITLLVTRCSLVCFLSNSRGFWFGDPIPPIPFPLCYKCKCRYFWCLCRFAMDLLLQKNAPSQELSNQTRKRREDGVGGGFWPPGWKTKGYFFPSPQRGDRPFPRMERPTDKARTAFRPPDSSRENPRGNWVVY